MISKTFTITVGLAIVLGTISYIVPAAFAAVCGNGCNGGNGGNAGTSGSGGSGGSGGSAGSGTNLLKGAPIGISGTASGGNGANSGNVNGGNGGNVIVCTTSANQDICGGTECSGTNSLICNGGTGGNGGTPGNGGTGGAGGRVP